MKIDIAIEKQKLKQLNNLYLFNKLLEKITINLILENITSKVRLLVFNLAEYYTMSFSFNFFLYGCIIN